MATEQSPLCDSSYSRGEKSHILGRNWKTTIAVTVMVLISGGLFCFSMMKFRVPEIEPLSRVARMDDDHLLNKDNAGRLVIVGDIHGMYDEFKELLKKVDFDEKEDRLVLLGDFTTKGPDSLKVVDKAIEYNAYCVRGNHEDEILSLYADRHHLKAPKTYPPYASKATMVAGKPPSPTLKPTAAAQSQGDISIEEDLGRDLPLVKHLKPHHIKYMAQCPAILQLGQVSKKGIMAVAVHGGLMWNEPDLENQDIWAVLRVRSVIGRKYDEPTEESDVGKNWFDLWNDEQKERPKNERYEVIYGHDASKGLQMHKYTKGLDTRCQKGGKLSAMVISVDKKGHFSQELVQIKC